MLEPFQNILFCMDAILTSRKSANEDKSDKLYCMVGEVDHMAEIYRQLDELDKLGLVIWVD